MMKIHNVWFVVGFIFLTLFGIQCQAADNNNVFTMATHAASKPWEFTNKNGNFAGIEIDMVKAIEASQGIKIKVVNMPWETAIASTAQRRVDGMFGGMSITPRRKKVMNFTRPIYQINFAIVVRNGSGLNAVTALTHGAVTSANAGTTGAAWVRNNLVNKGMDTKLKIYDSYVAALQAVSKGKIDSVLIDAPTAKSYIDKMHLKIVGTIASEEYLAWAVNKSDPNGLLAKLNAGINEMIKSGKLAKIYSKWGLPPAIPQLSTARRKDK